MLEYLTYIDIQQINKKILASILRMQPQFKNTPASIASIIPDPFLLTEASFPQGSYCRETAYEMPVFPRALNIYKSDTVGGQICYR